MMATDLFSHRTTGPGRNFINAKRAQGRRTLNIFAEALANGATISAAAATAGVSQQRGSRMLQHMRRELGWQAV